MDDPHQSTPQEKEELTWLASQQEPPPPYSETPHPELALEPRLLSQMPRTFRLVGHYTSPDFSLFDDHDQEILSVETDSFLISHEMELRELITGSRLFTIKRDAQKWMYTAKEPGKDGKKILEIETGSGLMRSKGQLTRLTFCNNTATTATKHERQLAALDLRFENGSKSDVAEVFHGDRKVAEIESICKKFKGPEYVLKVLTSGVDPTLLVIFALVMDDRSMSTRRRRRRPIGREALGIGKGPGAGLAMLYGLGSI